MKLATLVFILAILVIGCGGQRGKSEGKVFSQEAVPEVEGTSSIPRDGCDHYHVIVFSYNNAGNVVRPSQTHTFVSWIGSREQKVVEQVDISWGPIKGSRVQLLTETVPGKNKDLTTSIKNMRGYIYKYWVLRTDRKFFEDAVKMRDSLKYYRLLDGRTRPKAVNCIHACSDVAGHLETGTACGIVVGQMIADFYIRTGKASRCTDDWLVEAVLRHANCNLP